MTLFLFTILEFNPHLVKRLKLDQIHYYSLKGRYVPDPDLIFRNQPGFTYKGYFSGDIQGLADKPAPIPYEAEFDDEGFRNKGLKGPADVIVLGDSFIQFGLNEKDTFASRLGSKLGLKTANYGAEWYGPIQYLETFKKLGLPRSPKTALFCFFEGNDLRDTAQYLNWQKGGNYYHFNLTGKNFLQRYLIAMKDTVIFAIKRILKNWDPRKVRVTLSTQQYETVFTYPIDTRPKEVILNSPEGLKLREILIEFKQICEAQKISPLVLFIPSATHVYLPYTAETSSESLRARENTEKALEDLVKELSLNWLDLAPIYAEAAESGTILYYPADTHWNEKGRELAAQAAADKIKTLNLK